jgi:hypothetical protein
MELVMQWYFGKNLPRVLPHLRDGRISDTDGQVLKAGEDENPYIKKFFCLYDSPALLDDAYHILTRTKNITKRTTPVRGVDELIAVAEDRSMPNHGDVTHLYNHELGQMVSVTSGVKNSYDTVNEDHQIDILPDDFMHPTGKIHKSAAGRGFSAVLDATAAHVEESLGAIVAKKTEYVLGGKVVHVRAGKLVEEAYATGIDQEQGLVHVTRRTYDWIGDRYTRRETSEVYRFVPAERAVNAHADHPHLEHRLVYI